MSKLQEILDNFPDEEFTLLTGLDDAVIGVDAYCEPMRLVYSINEIVECFMREGMTDEEAIEYYEYNTARAVPYIPNSPLLIYTDFF
jgi:hypothetical protein